MAHFKFKRELLSTNTVSVSSDRSSEESLERSHCAIPESPSASLSPHSRNASFFTPILNKQIKDLMNTEERRVLSSLQKMGYVPTDYSPLSSSHHINQSNPCSPNPKSSKLNDDDTDQQSRSNENKENCRSHQKHLSPFMLSPCDAQQKLKAAKQSSTPSTTKMNNLSSPQFQSLVQSFSTENLACAAEDLAQKVFELDISNEEEFATQVRKKYSFDVSEKFAGSLNETRNNRHGDIFSSPTSSGNSANFEMSIHANSLDLSGLEDSEQSGNGVIADSSTKVVVDASVNQKENLTDGKTESLSESDCKDESLDANQTESYIAEPDEVWTHNLPTEGGIQVLDLDMSDATEFMTQYEKERSVELVETVTKNLRKLAETTFDSNTTCNSLETSLTGNEVDACFSKLQASVAVFPGDDSSNSVSPSEPGGSSRDTMNGNVLHVCNSEITKTADDSKELCTASHQDLEGSGGDFSDKLIERCDEEANESFCEDEDSDRTESYDDEVYEDTESELNKETRASSTAFETGIVDLEDGPGGFLPCDEEPVQCNYAADKSRVADNSANEGDVHSAVFETGLLDPKDEPAGFLISETEDNTSSDDFVHASNNSTREEVFENRSDVKESKKKSFNKSTKDGGICYWSVMEDGDKKDNILEPSSSIYEVTKGSQAIEEKKECIVLSEEEAAINQEEIRSSHASRFSEENNTEKKPKHQKYRRVMLDDSDEESDRCSGNELEQESGKEIGESYNSKRAESPDVEATENAGDESWNSPSNSNEEMEEPVEMRKKVERDLDDIVKKIQGNQERDAAANQRQVEILPYQYEERHLDPNHVFHAGAKGGYGAVYQASKITVKSLQSLHAALESCPGPDHMAEQPSIVRTVLREHQLHGLQWLLWRENQMPSGGILADDMGLGKTLQMISLIASQKERRQLECHDLGYKNHGVSKSTLVVAPASVMNVWLNEIEKHCRRTVMLSVCLFHGNHRVRDPNVLRRYDVVITSYATLAREVAEKLSAAMMKKESEVPADEFDDDVTAHTPLLRVLWRRVILDEAHQIKNPRTKCSIAACRLRAQSRWAVTGTPVHNNLKDFFSLLRFLRFSPFDEKHFFENQVEKHKQKSERINLISKFCLLRRTKGDMDKQGKALVDLPQKNFNIRILPMLPYDRKLHDFLFITSKEKVKKFLEEKRRNEMLGLRPGRNVMTNIFTLLLRLRQSCAHPMLVSQALESEDLVEIRKATKEAEEKMGLRDDKKEMDRKNSTTVAEDEDNDELIHEMSRLDISCVGTGSEESDDVDIDTEEEGGAKGVNKSGFIGEEYEMGYMSTKLKTLMEEIDTIVEKNERCVVVSEWTSYLRIASHHLKVSKIGHFTIEGSVPFKERDVAVENFNTSSSRYKVMLVSLKAGGVGLNLVGGNHLFLLDVHWNPALEAQAVDRIYRMGQSKDVHVHKLVCEDTIEDRVMKVQDNKRGIANEVLSGATTTKRSANLSLKDLKYIFGLDS